MLQRGLPAVLQWAPTLGSIGAHIQAAQLLQSASGFQQSCAHNLQTRRQFYLKPGIVDVRDQPKRHKPPYFNPADGDPERAYQYWKDLWAKPQRPPKQRRHSRRLPVYLEQEEQQELISAAVQVGKSLGRRRQQQQQQQQAAALGSSSSSSTSMGPSSLVRLAGIPAEVVTGSPRRSVPRLIAAIQAAGGAIPTSPDRLTERISSLRDLERQVPGLDLTRIFRANGFSILKLPPLELKQRVKYISEKLAQSGPAAAAAEPGLLVTAAVKPAMHYPRGIIERTKALPELFEGTLQVAPPPGLLQQPFTASIFLNKSHRKLQRRMQETVERYGLEAAADMYCRTPQLLLQQQGRLQAKTNALSKSLKLSAAAAQQLTARHPQLLGHSLPKLQRRIAALRALLHLPSRQQLGEVVTRQPSLLYKKPETLAAKLALIQKLLGVSSAAAAAQAAAAQPSLLAHSVDCLQAAADQFQAIPSTSPLAALSNRAQEVLSANPWLLTLGTSANPEPQYTLKGRLQMLEGLARQLGDVWQQQLGAWAAGDAAAVAKTLGHVQLADRVRWLLQTSTPDGAAAAVKEWGIAGILGDMSAKDFDALCCPGYKAEREAQASSSSSSRQQRRRAAAAAAAGSVEVQG